METSLAVSSQALVPVAGVVQETEGSKRIIEAVQTQSNKQLVYNSENLHRMFDFEGCSSININVNIQ